jgi:O-antigen/teichoic acid export membrane protein
VLGASLASLFIGLTLNIVFVVALEMGILGIFYSSLIANTVVGLVLGVWLLTRVGISFSKRQYRSLLRYGVPMIGMQVATFAATFGDRYFLQATGDTAQVGLYNLAYRFGFLLAAVGFGPFDQVWGPKRFEIARRGDRDELLSKGFLFLNLWLVWFALAISLFILDFFRIMTTPEFFSASRYVHLILVAYVFQVWASTQDIGILIREKTEYLTLANWIAAGVALTAFAILIPRFGGMGAAVATLFSLSTRWGLTYTLSQRLWRVEYRWGPVRRLVTLALAAAGIGLALPVLPILLSIPLRAVILLFFTCSIWVWVLDASERAQIAGKVTLYGGILVRQTRARMGRAG